MSTRLLIDSDDFQNVIRIWDGARVVGEIKPDPRATPVNELTDPRWTGWFSSEAVAEIVGYYSCAKEHDELVEHVNILHGIVCG